MDPKADLHISRLDIEQVAHQEHPVVFSFVDAAGDPAPVPAGAWTCHHGTGMATTTALVKVGDTLVLTIPADETWQAIQQQRYRIRRDGLDVIGGSIVAAKPQTTPGAAEVTVTLGSGDTVQVTITGGGGGEGTTDHRALTERDAADQHPMSAITGLTSALAGKEPTGTAAGLISALTPGDIGAVADDDERLDDARTPTAHTHAQADVTGLSTTLAAKADLVGGVVPTSQIPALATVEVYTVEDEDEMLALVCQRGDVAIRLDEEQAYILAGDDPSDLGDWTVLPSPSAPVTTVNGQIGTVVLGAGDVGAAAASHTHTSGQVSGLATVATTGAYSDLSGRPSIPSTAAAVGAVAAGTGVARIEAVTQDDYDLLTPVATTLYVIVED